MHEYLDFPEFYKLYIIVNLPIYCINNTIQSFFYISSSNHIKITKRTYPNIGYISISPKHMVK